MGDGAYSRGRGQKELTPKRSDCCISLTDGRYSSFPCDIPRLSIYGGVRQTANCANFRCITFEKRANTPTLVSTQWIIRRSIIKLSPSVSWSTFTTDRNSYYFTFPIFTYKWVLNLIIIKTSCRNQNQLCNYYCFTPTANETYRRLFSVDHLALTDGLLCSLEGHYHCLFLPIATLTWISVAGHDTIFMLFMCYSCVASDEINVLH